MYNSPAANLMFVLVEGLVQLISRGCVFDVGKYVLNDESVIKCVGHEPTEAFNIHSRGTLRSVY